MPYQKTNHSLVLAWPLDLAKYHGFAVFVNLDLQYLFMSKNGTETEKEKKS